MSHARPILGGVVHPQFIELDNRKLGPETTFGSNNYLCRRARDRGLVGNRIVETKTSASGHAEHPHGDQMRYCGRTPPRGPNALLRSYAGLAPDAIVLRGKMVRPC